MRCTLSIGAVTFSDQTAQLKTQFLASRQDTMTENEGGPKFSRTRLLGLDIIRVSDVDAIGKILSSGQVGRLTADGTEMEDLSWLFRWYFPKTRFFNDKLRGWFLPFRTKEDATYPPCRAFLDEKFGETPDITGFVNDAVNALVDSSGNVESNIDEGVLSDASIKAVWAHIVPQGHPAIPDDVLSAVRSQVGEVVDSFLPWKFLPGGPAVDKVYDYAEATLSTLNQRDRLPDAAVTDVAHCFFAMNKNAPNVLRRIAERPEDDLKSILCANGPVENVPRLCTETGTLGGVLPEEDPAQAKKTVVLFEVRKSAQITKDLSYVFSDGSERRCAAEQVIMNFFGGVQEEIRRRKSG